MSSLGWMPFAFAAALPLVLLLLGWLQPRRDIYWLAIYAQAVVYLFLAPNLAAHELPATTIARYNWLEWWLLLLFVVPVTGLYLYFVRRIVRGPGEARRFDLRPFGTIVVATMSLVLASGYLWVALSRNLLYRRLGWEGLAEAQLDLSLLEFGLYRTFIEAAPFLIAVQLFALRATVRRGSVLARVWLLSFSLTLAVYLIHVLVNSRLSTLLLVVFLMAIVIATASAATIRAPERLVLVAAAALIAFYGLRVAENVRLAVQSGNNPLSAENLIISGQTAGGGEEAYYWRLNGIDLMALSADNLESSGPAYGALWAAPALLALDPIVRTATTEQLKRAALTNAKSFMLLRYAGMSLPDYYACLVTDAYGNFGRAGFVLAALVVAGIAALVASGLGVTSSPALAIIAVFFAARLLPFEQEFATVLFGWVKLLPVLLVVLAVRPLRRSLHVPAS